MEKDKIRVMMVLDVIGRPPEHLIASLEQMIGEIDKEKGVSVKMKDIKKPTLAKEEKDIYTTFAEVEVEIEDMINLVILLFKYMPAHVEIISPEMLVMSNAGWNDIINELARRLHGYDEIARILQAEKGILLKTIEDLGGDLNKIFPQNPEREETKKKKA